MVRAAKKDGKVISVAGGRHAMGGQQFGTDTILIDIRSLSRVLHLDRQQGTLEVEAGIEWPELIGGYLALQRNDQRVWGIAQKQTGADRLTIAGAIAANAHGRGLKMKPFISDVESLVLVDANGVSRRCSRAENGELFGLVHGGRGLFGIVTSVRLRLIPRTKVERVVEIQTVDELAASFEERINEGFQYGDFQFAIDRESDDFLRKGVFSCYTPVQPTTPIAKTYDCPTKIGGSFCTWPTRMERPSRGTPNTTFRRMGRYIGRTLTNCVSILTITTTRSTGNSKQLIPTVRSSPKQVFRGPC